MATSLNCLLLEKAFEDAFPIDIDTENSINGLNINVNELTIGHLKFLIWKKNKDTFQTNGPDSLILWKVNITFTDKDKLVGVFTEDDITQKLKGEELMSTFLFRNYFQGNPPRGNIHVIVQLPNITTVIPSQKQISISSLNDLEEWLFDGLGSDQEYKPYNHSVNVVLHGGKWIEDFREKFNEYKKLVNLKSEQLEQDVLYLSSSTGLHDLVNYFLIKNQTHNNCQHIMEYLEEEKQPISNARLLGTCKVSSVEDDELLMQLELASDAFEAKFRKSAPISIVIPRMINGDGSLMVWVDLPKGTPVDLPAKFGEYPVYVDYGIIELAHRAYHKILRPGISISDTNKKYVLTAQHGVKSVENKVIQPGSTDTDKINTFAKVTEYNHYGVYEDNGENIYLDYKPTMVQKL
ncbi:hypothetical protein C1645_744313 [Glomus cerebriforme]|uniref:Crinkler effector protein N-terminal domain-containing protein n=1 Tax=Glomus cerebriforme TaxID=658196 RepID=A0A397SGZ1_9GLOM|nr:hypothetical protein C1645_744313 [Glomus cerebriforme]